MDVIFEPIRPINSLSNEELKIIADGGSVEIAPPCGEGFKYALVEVGGKICFTVIPIN